MNLFKSGNPALQENKFRSTVLDTVIVNENAMTVKGTMQKFGILFLMVLAASVYSWREFSEGGNAMPLIYTGAIGGFVVALVMIFKPHLSQYLAPLYGILEGLFLGAISSMYNAAFAETAPNIVINAIGLTFAVVLAMYLLYSFKIIQATQKFKSIVMAATMGIAIFYLITWIMHFAGMQAVPFLHQGSWIGIAFSLFVTAIAALNLIIDFDMIEQGAATGAPKYMEWYGAFGLLVTIVWLYLEILRLLSKLSSRD